MKIEFYIAETGKIVNDDDFFVVYNKVYSYDEIEESVSARPDIKWRVLTEETINET